MANTVKLKDGSYIDASAIYDTTEGKTQAEVNASKSNIVMGKFWSVTTNSSKYWSIDASIEGYSNLLAVPTANFGITGYNGKVWTGIGPASTTGGIFALYLKD